VLKHWRRSGAGAGSPEWPLPSSVVALFCAVCLIFCSVREEQGKGCSVREFITVQLEDSILHIL
jgi:hypothetical protein